MRDYLFVLLIAAVVTYLLTPAVRRAAIAFGAVKKPRDRDVHTEPVPEMGGIAMYAGLAAGLLVADRLTYLRQAFPSPSTVTGLLAAGGLLVVIGIVDDRWGLSVISKLAGQVAAGGILIWSGVVLPWLPLPGGEPLLLEPDLGYTLTILLVVVTINAVNFIDGLDGLAAGVVGIAGLSFLIYSYNLANSVHTMTQSVAAVASAVLTGMCAGFLPHNFNPARIFMGDTGAMLIGLLLAYAPISSTSSLDPSLLTSYEHLHPLNRFPTILPILLPVAILLIPYADLLFAVVRRTAAGRSPFAADGKHLHHRLLNMGHSHRQSVLLMYLWASLFSGLVVGLSVVRIPVIWLAVVTLAAFAGLMLATMPRLRPWHAPRGLLGEEAGVPDRHAAEGKPASARDSRVRSGRLGTAMLSAPVPDEPVRQKANGAVTRATGSPAGEAVWDGAQPASPWGGWFDPAPDGQPDRGAPGGHRASRHSTRR